jgi:hypothetical protein
LNKLRRPPRLPECLSLCRPLARQLKPRISDAII